MPSTIYEPKGRANEYALLALNLYKGCPHGCKYCYVPGILHIEPKVFHSQDRNCLRDGIIPALEYDSKQYAGTQIRVNMCFTCDPYPAFNDAGATREAIAILRKRGIPLSILTKGGLPAARDFGLYDNRTDIFGVTITTPDDSQRKIIEPYAAPIADRIETLKEAQARGIFTFVSLEPAIDTEKVLRIVELTAAYTDHYKIGALNYLRPTQLGIPADPKLNWRELGIAAIETLQKLNKTIYIKEDLAKLIPAKIWTQTDTRQIQQKQYSKKGGQ